MLVYLADENSFLNYKSLSELTHFEDVSVSLAGRFVYMRKSWVYLLGPIGKILVTSCGHFGDILEKYLDLFGHLGDIIGDNLGISQGHLGDILGTPWRH